MADIKQIKIGDTTYDIKAPGAIQEPSSEGTAGQVLITDGSGGRSWGSVSGSGSSVTVDTTLTQSGMAADAKVTGDVITVIKNILQKATFTEDVSSLFTQLENLLSSSSEANITQSGSVLTVISGVTVSQSGTVLTLS